MNPTLKKALHYALIVTSFLAMAGPGLAKTFLELELPKWAHVMSAAAGFAGMVQLYLLIPLSKSDTANGTPTAMRPPPLSLFLVVIAAFSGTALACNWFRDHGPQTIVDVGGLVACVLQHDTEPVQQIALECGSLTAQDVIQILEAHKAAVAREHPTCPAPLDAGPGK